MGRTGGLGVGEGRREAGEELRNEGLRCQGRGAYASGGCATGARSEEPVIACAS